MEESDFGKVHFLSKKPAIRDDSMVYNKGIIKCKHLMHGQAEQYWAAMLFFPFNGLYQPNIAKTAKRK